MEGARLVSAGRELNGVGEPVDDNGKVMWRTCVAQLSPAEGLAIGEQRTSVVRPADQLYDVATNAV